MSLASDSLTSKASLTHAQVISSGDMGFFQVLHVHVEGRGNSMKHQQEPCVPKHILRKCQGENFPPGAKKASPPGSKAKGHGGGNARLGTSQSGKKSSPAKVILGSKSSHTLSQKVQPAKSRFSQKMKHFSKWICHGKENTQEKSSCISSVQSRGVVQSRDAFSGMTEAQKIMTLESS